MTGFKNLRNALLIAACGLAAPAAAQSAHDFVYLAPTQVPFKSPLGAGPEQAVLFGDPSRPGVYVLRVRFPPGFHSNPHFHSQDRHATVIKGVWWNGTGDKLDFKQARPVEAGSYVLHPAGGVHWDGAGDEEVVVQIIGVGPVETTAVGGPSDPASDHWPKPKQAE
ncbi:cupin domain-containing protein [Rhodoblastus sp.]|jgi:quercetin dioxygenase-like cupin family protein|uniref:cupin domain-containing protein n=1 Tax=Rhodoblastus sp. TaxID=1962975 RepID=UPI0025FFD3E4|nr:cupin domain-containing protein [Rhodoblastus sp.]